MPSARVEHIIEERGDYNFSPLNGHYAPEEVWGKISASNAWEWGNKVGLRSDLPVFADPLRSEGIELIH